MKKRVSLLTVLSVLVIISMMTVGLVAAAPNPGNGSTDIRVMNTNTNLSASAAQVIVDYYNTSGTVERSVHYNVPSLGSHDFLASASGLGDGFNGAAVISSDQQLASVAYIHWTGGQSHDGTTAAAYNGFSTGATTMYCASLAARPAQSSKIAIQNADTGSASVKVHFYDRSGNEWTGGPINKTIPQGASKVVDLSTLNLPTTTPPGDGWLGSVKVESTNSKKIAAVVTLFWNDFSSAYNCVPSGTTTLNFPDVKRRYIHNTWAQYGGNIVQNLSTSPAHIHAHWVNRSGTELYSFDDTIPAMSSHGYNTRWDANTPNPSALFTALGDDAQIGLKITSDQPLAGVYNSLTVSGSNKRASSYIAEGAGSTHLFFPAAYRLKAGSAFTKFSALLVYNPGTTAATVTLHWYDQSGTEKYSFSDTIPGGSSHGYNTRYGANVPNPTALYNALGDNFKGAVYVSSTALVVGLSNTNYADQQATYNAFGQ